MFPERLWQERGRSEEKVEHAAYTLERRTRFARPLILSVAQVWAAILISFSATGCLRSYVRSKSLRPPIEGVETLPGHEFHARFRCGNKIAIEIGNTANEDMRSKEQKHKPLRSIGSDLAICCDWKVAIEEI